jgi:hypothetical protein
MAEKKNINGRNKQCDNADCDSHWKLSFVVSAVLHSFCSAIIWRFVFFRGGEIMNDMAMNGLSQ